MKTHQTSLILAAIVQFFDVKTSEASLEDKKE